MVQSLSAQEYTSPEDKSTNDDVQITKVGLGVVFKNKQQTKLPISFDLDRWT